MKAILSLTTLAALLCISTAANAKPIHSAGRTGIGLGSGTIANGLSLKHFMSDSLALQANLGTVGGRGGDRFKDNGGIAASADLLIENSPLIASSLLNLEWNYGLGAGIGFRNDNSAIAAAGVLGLEVNFNVIPIDIVLEYRPNLALSPDVELDFVDFSGHLRYYFQ